MHDGRSSPDEPAGADARPELARASDAQLKAWAFGRQSADGHPELAESALRELARRAGGPAAEGDPPAPASPAGRSRLRRPAFFIVAGIALAAIIATTFAVFAPRTPSSLAVFDREATALEVQLSELVQQGGFGRDADVRVLAEAEVATVVAFRTSELSSHSSGTVCVAVIEFEVVSGATCTSVDDFTAAGIVFTLRGRTGLIAIDWGPQGEPLIRLTGDFEVGPSGG